MAAEAQPTLLAFMAFLVLLAERACPTRVRPVSTSSRSLGSGRETADRNRCLLAHRELEPERQLRRHFDYDFRRRRGRQSGRWQRHARPGRRKRVQGRGGAVHPGFENRIEPGRAVRFRRRPVLLQEELANAHESYLFLDIDFNLDGAVDFNDCFDPMAVAFGLPPSAAGAATEALFNSLGFSLAGFATLGCNARNTFTQDKTSTAAYFDGSYELTDALLLRYGVRYTRDDAEQNRFNAHLAGADDVPVFGTINGGSADPLATIAGQDFSDSEVTGRIGLDYTTPNGTLFYGSFQHGYRGGAFNAQAYYDPGEISIAEPEYLDSFEVGFKSTLWEGRVRLNGAAFSYSYDNQQFISIDVVTFVQTLINIDESEIRGLEIEAAAQLSPAILVQLGVGVLDTEVKKGILAGDDLSGRSLPGAPELNVNASVDWDLFSTENGRLTLHLDATFQDETLYVYGAGMGDSYTVFTAA